MKFKLSAGAGMMLISIVSFSLMHLCVKAISGIPVHQIITFRSVFSILICIYTLKKNNIPFWGNNKPLLIARGLVGASSLFCFLYSIQLLPLATAVTISNLIPLFTLGLAAVFLKEKITRLQWFFFTLPFIGILLIKGFDDRIALSGLLIALSAAFLTACAHFSVRKLREYDHPAVIIFYFPLVTIPITAPYTAMYWVQPDSFSWCMLILIGLFTHIGQVYLTHAYAKEEISGVSNMYYVGILLSLFYGWVFFDEVYPFMSFIGMALIISGIILNMYYKKTTERNV